MTRVGWFLAGSMVLLLASCRSLGPRTIVLDRFDYNISLSDSWKEQMLLNMVRLRYADAPVFLEVASVISQRSLDRNFNTSVSGTYQSVQPGGSRLHSVSPYLGMSGSYGDRPTVTYAPLLGDRFVRSLMTPIPPSALLGFAQAGWRVDSILLIGVQSINGIRNRSNVHVRARPADPDFYRLIEMLRRIQTSGAAGIRIERKEGRDAMLVFLRGKLTPELEADVAAVKKLLGLRTQADEFRVSYGSIARDDQEIAMLSRSMLEILAEMASCIDVPPAHVAEQRVAPTIAEQPDSGAPDPLIRVHSGQAEPADAFVSVRYRGHWFWIDDRDLHAKRMFTSLMMLFTLADLSGIPGAPIVTLPAGG